MKRNAKKKQAALVALLAALPGLSAAQTKVPPLLQAQAAAAAQAGGKAATAAGARVKLAANTAGADTHTGTAGSAHVPASMPPPIHLLSPSATLDAKEAHAAYLARLWRDRHEMPQPGRDGVVRFPYGATIPSIVCAPLHVCDLELQPGEVVLNIDAGDKVRWKFSPAIVGSGANAQTIIVIKPVDAGLRTNLSITTTRRVYSVNLVSMRRQWTPLVGFTYPSDQAAQWAAYQRQAEAGAFGSPASSLASPSAALPGGNAADLDFNYHLGGSAPWKPLRVYNNGAKTFIDFPPGFQNMREPVLVTLSGGGLFSAPKEDVIDYRQIGNEFVVDGVLRRAALVSGVGAGQRRVTITERR